MEVIYVTSPEIPYPAEIVPDGVTVHYCTDFNEFTSNASRSAVFVIAAIERTAAIRILEDLRRDPRSGLQPMYTESRLGDPFDHISDGIIHSLAEAVNQAPRILERISQLDATLFAPDTSDFFRILGYMFSRTETPLEPRRFWSNESFYTYPVLEAMLGSVELVASRLSSMYDRKLVQRDQLVDRLRHCPSCNGVHLNFIDCCPNCSSINILQKSFLHCFTCGTVAPEDRYVEKGILQCPNCKTRLRHIGADYDRPLENYECQNCSHVFIDPDVQAHCMHCGTRTPPDKLISEQVFTYSLTDLGAQAAKSGTMEDVFALLDMVNNVSPSYFMNLVGWLMQIARRHPEEQFSIIGIKLKNLLELDAQFGKPVVVELLDALALRLRELVRSTDLATRTGQQMFWLLLPKTGRSNYQIVLNRVLELRNLAYRVEGVGLDFETVVFNAPEDLIPGETGKLLLARLEGDIE